MVFDPITRTGACGDWCVSPCVEGAFLSGLQLAEAIAAHYHRKEGTGCRMYPPDRATVRIHQHRCAIAAFPGWLDPPTTLSSELHLFPQVHSCPGLRQPALSKCKEGIDELCSGRARWSRHNGYGYSSASVGSSEQAAAVDSGYSDSCMAEVASTGTASKLAHPGTRDFADISGFEPASRPLEN